jgi:hypothetical protein
MSKDINKIIGKHESESLTYSIDSLGLDNKHPQNAENYYVQAILKAYKLNDITGALDDFDKSILFGSSSENELNPQHANTYYHRAVLKQIKLDDVPGALSDYDYLRYATRTSHRTKSSIC